MSMYIGEALDGEGNEIAHIDLLIGSKDGPVGVAFCLRRRWQRQSRRAFQLIGGVSRSEFAFANRLRSLDALPR